MNKYSEKEIEEFKRLESLIRLNQLKVGDVINEQLENDLRVLTGPRLTPKSHSIVFDKVGKAHTTSDIFASVEADGLDILKRPEGEQ